MAKHVQIHMNTCKTTYEYKTNCKLFKLKQWGWVTSSHNLSYDPSPTILTYIKASKHG